MKDQSVKTFLVGLSLMVSGGLVAIVAPSFSVNWISDVGLIVLAIGALVAASATEQKIN